MSLINEALKRAEAEKNGTPLPRPEASSTYGTDRLGLRKASFPTGKLIAVSAVGLFVALSSWLVMDKFSSWIAPLSSPATAQAADGQQRPAANPAVGQPSPVARPDFADSLAPAAKQLSSSDFKLSAILHGPSGATVIINGQFLQIGSTIEEATVVSIGQHKVILDANGRRITLQM